MHNTKQIISLLKEAGEIAKKYFKQEVKFSFKEDHSEVSEADIEISNFLIDNISKISTYPVISEESKAKAEEIKEGNFWLIDPIDGTRSFINKKESFVINIALIKDFSCYLGFICSPLEDKLFYNIDENKTFIDFKGKVSEIKALPIKEDYIAAISYQSKNIMLENFLYKNKIDKFINIPSGIKLCMMLEGKAHLYPKFGLTMEWDTAAGHALLKTIGGNIVDFKGEEIKYGKQDFKNPNFIALSHNEIFNKLKI